MSNIKYKFLSPSDFFTFSSSKKGCPEPESPKMTVFIVRQQRCSALLCGMGGLVVSREILVLLCQAQPDLYKAALCHTSVLYSNENVITIFREKVLK